MQKYPGKLQERIDIYLYYFYQFIQNTEKWNLIGVNLGKKNNMQKKVDKYLAMISSYSFMSQCKCIYLDKFPAVKSVTGV